MAEYAQAERTYGADEPERESIVKEFEWATGDLEKALGELSQRLTPLFRPNHDVPKESRVNGAAESVSVLRTHLHSVHDQTARVRWLLDRLEV